MWCVVNTKPKGDTGMAKTLAKVTKLPVKGRTRAQWADAINKSWKVAIDAAKSAVKAGVTTGQFLLQAKETLPYGDFTEMVEKDLPFSITKANDLMRIAANPQISDHRHGGFLPDGWTVLRKLADLTAEDFKWAKDRGLINKNMTRGSALAIKKARTTKDDGQPINISKGERGPTPDEARKIARETGRLIVASDGNIYSGATEEEQTDYANRRNIVYPIKDAIVRIANCELDADEWIKKSEKHWLHSFPIGAVDDAIKWLSDLRPLLAKRQKIVEGGSNAA